MATLNIIYSSVQSFYITYIIMFDILNTAVCYSKVKQYKKKILSFVFFFKLKLEMKIRFA